jgi:hypothetical protein
VVRTIGAKIIKVFWFFFSKKNALALILEVPDWGKVGIYYDVATTRARVSRISRGRIF